MSLRREVIETTASNVAAELARRGIGSNERVIVTIEPNRNLSPDVASRGREASPRV